MAELPHTGKSGRPPVRPLWVIDIGRQAYEEAWGLQRRLARARLEERVPDVLLLLEHDPVLTLGRRGRPESVLLSPEDLRARGMTCIRTERGGDVTYHGPGQLVGYPIVRVPGQGREVKALVRGFEEVLLRTLARFGIQGRRDPKNPGVWVGGAKIGSIGISVQHGISFHGFSLNVDMDLTPFSWIQPCGHPNLPVTSLRELLREGVSVPEVKEAVASAFLQTLSYRSLAPEETQALEAEVPGLASPGTRSGQNLESRAGWIEGGGERAGWERLSGPAVGRIRRESRRPRSGPSRPIRR